MSPQTSTNVQKSQDTFWNSAEFAARLRQERTRTGLNQKDFGALGGATLDSQSRYETGKNTPSAEYLAGLAANQVDVNFILTGDRSDSAALPADASELLDDYFGLGSGMRTLARALVRTVRVSGPLPATTVHTPALTFQAEERG
ncbi:MAG TPA: helix-turn-helix domain-containing protein [Allosphingosinicella sp.]|jgi:transcriptional regulator with XRE-family HTH domain